MGKTVKSRIHVIKMLYRTCWEIQQIMISDMQLLISSIVYLETVRRFLFLEKPLLIIHSPKIRRRSLVFFSVMKNTKIEIYKGKWVQVLMLIHGFNRRQPQENPQKGQKLEVLLVVVVVVENKHPAWVLVLKACGLIFLNLPKLNTR